MLFAPPWRDFVATLLNFCSCCQDKFVMKAKPGLAHLHAIEIMHHDKFLAPRQLPPRHCASAHLPTFCYRDRFSATYQPCTATHVMLNKICTCKLAPSLKQPTGLFLYARPYRAVRLSNNMAVPILT